MSEAAENWLLPEEQAAWRAFIKFDSLLMSRLDADLMSHFSLSLAEYEVLVHLSEAPEGELRMSVLACLSKVSRSGLTRRLDNLIEDGLVEKKICPSDRRGMIAKLTEMGYRRILESAPTHVAGVRRYFISKFSKADLAIFTQFLTAPLQELEAKMPGQPTCE